MLLQEATAAGRQMKQQQKWIKTFSSVLRSILHSHSNSNSNSSRCSSRSLLAAALLQG
jgi:hypothetical protein